jgi:hypothetical protein
VDIYRYYAPGDQLMRLLVRWPGPYSKRAQRRRTKAAA